MLLKQELSSRSLKRAKDAVVIRWGHKPGDIWRVGEKEAAGQVIGIPVIAPPLNEQTRVEV